MSISYDPVPGNGLLFQTMVELRIFLQTETIGPGGKIGITRRAVGGFSGDRPIIVREGTIIPEGSASAVEIEFDAPAGSDKGVGHKEMLYTVQRIPD